MKKRLCCLDCRIPYRDFPCDCNVSDALWETLVGRPGGVLCPNCIARRIVEKTDATFVTMAGGTEA